MTLASTSVVARVYPRPCGETPSISVMAMAFTGLSPPMRGNPPCRGFSWRLLGSIPAHAGKPRCRFSRRGEFRVYPRPCGETAAASVRRPIRAGLSPPMRGNPAPQGGPAPGQGSIPAHAGKPALGHVGLLMSRVYPRPCGETGGGGGGGLFAPGLSPPMRGNPGDRDCMTAAAGSIPAHAGKPVRPTKLPGTIRVYPRPCGETQVSGSPRQVSAGLSPPMRGNPGFQLRLCGRCGSIPAHAGKPAPAFSGACPSRVYPRPCGETLTWAHSRPGPQGLSPPMRGNLHAHQRVHAPGGSIPAHAGKPAVACRNRRHDRVYPRPCGETSRTARSTPGGRGLSPPMRGNLFPSTC